MAQIYDEGYYRRQHYSEKEKAVRNLYSRFLEWANVTDGQNRKAVDIGAGFGYVVRLLEELGYDSVGLEDSPYACKESQLGARMFNGNVLDLPFESESFDLVTCFETIEHIKQPEIALLQIHRVLKQNGILLMTTPTHFGSWISRQNKYHPSVKTYEEWRAILDSVLFHKCKWQHYGITPRIHQSYHLFMTPRIIPATHMVIEAWR